MLSKIPLCFLFFILATIPACSQSGSGSPGPAPSPTSLPELELKYSRVGNTLTVDGELNTKAQPTTLSFELPRSQNNMTLRSVSNVTFEGPLRKSPEVHTFTKYSGTGLINGPAFQMTFDLSPSQAVPSSLQIRLKAALAQDNPIPLNFNKSLQAK